MRREPGEVVDQGREYLDRGLHDPSSFSKRSSIRSSGTPSSYPLPSFGGRGRVMLALG